MRADNWISEEVELEGWAVKVTSYEINDRFLTEIDAMSSGTTLARGIASNREESRGEAFKTASRRLQRTRLIDVAFGDLTVGG
jgi:hypothetical protein